MRIQFRDFVASDFSFHKEPVLILEGFWTPEELAYFQDAMRASRWTPLSELSNMEQFSKDCGNWLQGEFKNEQDRDAFCKRIDLPFIVDYVNSFPDIKKGYLGFKYYTYGAGDCLTLHDDVEGYSNEQRPVRRRLAVATYLHSEWKHNWGGELILYETHKDETGKKVFQVSHCIPPESGSLVIFTVPRLHRVCRIDPLAGNHKRLSIAGWLSTEH